MSSNGFPPPSGPWGQQRPDGGFEPPRPLPLPRPNRPRPARTGWQLAGVVLAVVLAVCGLAVVAFGVLFMIGMSQWGSNK